MHPSHHAQLTRLNKIEGQVKGIKRMIEDNRYCVDILAQLKAVRSATQRVEQEILKTHTAHCLKNAVISGDPVVIQQKIDEIMGLLKNRV